MAEKPLSGLTPAPLRGSMTRAARVSFQADPRCLTPGRSSTYRRGESVQRTGATSGSTWFRSRNIAEIADHDKNCCDPHFGRSQGMVADFRRLRECQRVSARQRHPGECIPTARNFMLRRRRSPAASSRGEFVPEAGAVVAEAGVGFAQPAVRHVLHRCHDAPVAAQLDTQRGLLVEVDAAAIGGPVVRGL